MDDIILDNQIYYFKIGNGKWEGDFSFTLTDKKRYLGDPIGIKNRFLVNAMIIFQKAFGKCKISSKIDIFPDEEKCGVAKNIVRIHKFGMTVYLLKESYILNPNGKDVEVIAKDRFGPIPFLFAESKKYSAEIHSFGLNFFKMEKSSI